MSKQTIFLQVVMTTKILSVVTKDISHIKFSCSVTMVTGKEDKKQIVQKVWKTLTQNKKGKKKGNKLGS